MTLSRSLRPARALLAAALMGAAWISAALAATDDFLDPAQAFVGSAQVLDGKTLQLDRKSVV